MFSEMSNEYTRKERSSSPLSNDGKTPQEKISFPWRLHELLSEAETNGNDIIISWIPNTNNVFKVHNKELFEKDILSEYFNATKYKSFQRNLNLWGFQNITSGPNKGGYQHPIFIRSDREKCHYMTRRRRTLKGNWKHLEQTGGLQEWPSMSRVDDHQFKRSQSQLSALAGRVSASQVQGERYQDPYEVKGASLCEKLHLLLARPELQGCIRWTPDGRCFSILDPIQFNGLVLNTYFPGKTLRTFFVELESYGFKHIAHAGFQDCYYHDLMIQGCQHLCKYLLTPEESRRFISHDPSKDLNAIYTGSPFQNSIQSCLADLSIQRLLQTQQGGIGGIFHQQKVRRTLSGLALTSLGRQAALPQLNPSFAMNENKLQSHTTFASYLADLQANQRKDRLSSGDK